MSLSLNVVSLDKQRFTLAAASTATGKELKELIANAKGLAIGDVKLTSAGKVIKDDKTLAESGLTDGAELSLLASLGGAQSSAGAAAGAGAEEEDVPNLMRDFFGAMMQALVPNATKPDGTRDMNAIKAALLPDAMALLSGNWAPLDKTHGPVKSFLSQRMKGTSPQERQEFIELLINEGKKFAATKQQSDLVQEVTKRLKPDSQTQAFDAAQALTKRHMSAVLDLYLDHEGPNFGRQLRPILVTAVGESVDKLAPFLQTGTQGVNEIMATACQKLSALAVKKVPDLQMLSAMVLPMASGIVNQWYQEWKGLQ